MKELNPNHPVTQQVHEHWHKIAAMIMHKFGKSEVTLSAADMDLFVRDHPNCAVVVDSGKKYESDLVIRIVSMEEGERLARKEGGLPT